MTDKYDPYHTPEAALENRETFDADERRGLYALARANQYLMRVYLITLFSYLFPPLLLLMSIVAIPFTFRVAVIQYGGLVAIVIAPLAFLPIIGLIVMAYVAHEVNKRLQAYGFDLKMDAASLEPIQAWAENG
jgi:hypothetical protein